MDAEARLRCRVSPEVLSRFEALARRRGVDVPTLLRQLVGDALEADAAASMDAGELVSIVDARIERLTVRLRPGDGALLRDRAEARGLKPSTYLAHLVRGHLRQAPGIPVSELVQLKQAAAAVAELARCIRSQQAMHNDSAMILAQIEAVRAGVAAVVRANLESWESPDA